LARFRTEARAIARLRHPNIVQVYEVSEHEGVPFFSLEFCPGGSLDRKLKTREGKQRGRICFYIRENRCVLLGRKAAAA
jgi:serine/threonine protein kinase